MERIISTMMKKMDIYGVLGSVAMNIEESEFHNQFVVNAYSMNYSFGDDDRPLRIIKSFIAATTSYLTKIKVANEDEATALILTDLAGNFKFAGVVTYKAAAKAEEPGSWEYTLTFNEEDITELESEKTVNKFFYSDTPFRSIYDKVSYDIGVQFQSERSMFDSCLLTVDTIQAVLDGVAKAGEVVDIDIPGYAKFSVSVEDDNKIFAITPDGAQKHIINAGDGDGGDTTVEAAEEEE